MTYNLQHKIFSIVLALIVLCSTLSFTVEKHYCGDVLVEMSMFTALEKCGMSAKGFKVETPPCCKDEIAIVQGQDELHLSVYKVLKFYKQHLLLHTFVFSGLGIDMRLNPSVRFNAHAPPDIIPNIQIRDQVFLI